MADAYQNAAEQGTQAAFAESVYQTSDVATQRVEVVGTKNRKRPDLAERLFVARSRAALEANQISETNTDLGGNRGQWAFIKLMTSEPQYQEYLSGNTARKIGGEKSDMLGDEGIVTMMSNPSSGNVMGGYDRFLLTNVSGQMAEKVQITEVFGDNEVIYYFGREPMIFNFQGLLIDSPDNNWLTDWLRMYSEFFRGTQLARNAELLKIVLPNMEVIGTISSFNWAQDASRDVDIPFSFQFIAKVVKPLPAVGTIVQTNKLAQIDWTKASGFIGQEDINSLKGQVNSLAGVLMDPTSTLGDRSAALQKLGTGTSGMYGLQQANQQGTLAGFQSTIAGWDKSRASFFNEIQNSAMFQSVTSSLLSVRMNLFAPIYGIMSSLSKLVINSFNSTVGLFNSVINPVRNILRDITNISNQAVALVNLVNTAVSGVGRVVNGGLNGVVTDFNRAFLSLGKAAGAIATAPITVAQSIGNMFSGSQITRNAPFLKTSNKLTFSRPVLPIGSAPVPTKASLLAGIVPLNISKPVL